MRKERKGQGKGESKVRKQKGIKEWRKEERKGRNP